MPLANSLQRSLDRPSKLRRRLGDGAPLLAEDPAHERLERGVLRNEGPVLEASHAAVHALDPPRRVARHLDPRLADRLAELPVGPAAVPVDVELLGKAEIPLSPRCEADVGANPRDAE